MTFCGYNDTMAAGLRLFVEGMVQAMEERHATGTSMDDVVRSEISDLKAMNETLAAYNVSKPKLKALAAINDFAQAVFSDQQVNTSQSEDFRAGCIGFGEEFINLVRMTEQQHLVELTRRNAKPGDSGSIEALGHWLGNLDNLAAGE